MPKRRRTGDAALEDTVTDNGRPAPSVETDLGLLVSKSAIPKILVAAMVGRGHSACPKDMPYRGGICFLVGKRLATPGSETYSYPCGLLQSGEPIRTCASRIVREQTGLEVEAEEIIRTTEDVIEGEHYITLFVYCYLLTEQRLQDGNPEWTDWHWTTLDREDAGKMIYGEDPKEPLFAPLVSLYDEEKTRYINWDREPGITL